MILKYHYPRNDYKTLGSKIKKNYDTTGTFNKYDKLHYPLSDILTSSMPTFLFFLKIPVRYPYIKICYLVSLVKKNDENQMELLQVALVEEPVGQ